LNKAGYKFGNYFSGGGVGNVIPSLVMAKDLAYALLQDKWIKELFAQNDYQATMNTKFQLSIHSFLQ
jgi:hypothetical protein